MAPNSIPTRVLFPLLAAVAFLLLLAGHWQGLWATNTPECLCPASQQTNRVHATSASIFRHHRTTSNVVQSADTEAVALSQPFPAKIWQCWKDDAEDPTARTVGFPHQWREVNPSWRYERITHANMDAYVRSAFPYAADAHIVNAFTTLTDHILRADLLRYLILLREGGVWADIDVLPHRPVTEWVPEAYRGRANLVVGIETDHHKRPVSSGLPYSVNLAQFVVLAKPGHPALRVLVDRVVWNLQSLLERKRPGSEAVITFEDVMATTGPYAFTDVMMQYFKNVTGVEHTGDEMDRMAEPRLIGDVLVLPKDSFGWPPHENTHAKGDPTVLVEHLFIASWRPSHPG